MHGFIFLKRDLKGDLVRMVKYFSVAIFTCSDPLRFRMVLAQRHPPEGKGTKKLWVYVWERFI